MVGRVLSAEQHPNADRLRVCQVDDGSGEPRTIVCGAPNVAAGQTVAVARPGAVMPDGTKLGEAKLRGDQVERDDPGRGRGRVGEDHGGIMVLDDGHRPARRWSRRCRSRTRCSTWRSPEPPDCLSVYGVARELHALTHAPLAPDPTDEDAEPAGEALPRSRSTRTSACASPCACSRT